MPERLIILPDGYEAKNPNSKLVSARKAEDMFLKAGGKPGVDYTFMDCFNIAYKHELWNSIDLTQTYLCNIHNDVERIHYDLEEIRVSLSERV